MRSIGVKGHLIHYLRHLYVWYIIHFHQDSDDYGLSFIGKTSISGSLSLSRYYTWDEIFEIVRNIA